MSELPPQDLEDEHLRLLERGRSVTKIMFGFRAVLAILPFVIGLRQIVVGAWGEIFS